MQKQNERGEFFKEFLKDWRKVGSIIPSSSFLSKKMASQVKGTRGEVVIELGAGQGTITKKLLEKMHKDSRLIAFEINARFCKRLRDIALSDKRLVVVEAPVFEVKKILGEQTVDCIVSGIPLANFSAESKQELLILSKSALRSGGSYVQFQYSLELRPYLKQIFDEVKIKFIPVNIPPAFVYTCLKK